MYVFTVVLGFVSLSVGVSGHEKRRALTLQPNGASTWKPARVGNRLECVRWWHEAASDTNQTHAIFKVVRPHGISSPRSSRRLSAPVVCMRAKMTHSRGLHKISDGVRSTEYNQCCGKAVVGSQPTRHELAKRAFAVSKRRSPQTWARAWTSTVSRAGCSQIGPPQVQDAPRACCCWDGTKRLDER
jgi:hypothetical protein